MEYLSVMCLILISALLMGYLASRIGLPTVVGQIVAGIILGPAILGILQLNHLISVGSNLGIVLLMFLAGLECDFEQVKKYLKSATGIAACGVILPMLVFLVLGLLMNQGLKDALFWGVIFSATSVSISVAVLQEFGKLQTVAGAVILGAAVVDDVISIILLSLFSSIFESQAASPLVIIGMQLLYLIFIIVMIKWIVPEIIKLTSHFNDDIAISIVGICLCFLMAYLAEEAHLSSVLGAFFAGIAVAMTPAKKTVIHSTNLIGYSFFIPIFFVSVGLELKLVGSWQGWLLVLVMTILAILTKWIGCGVGAKIFGFDWHDSNIVGSGMVSRGEMALIIAQIGLSSHLVSASLYSEIILVVILTTVLSPIMLKWSIKSV